MSVLLQRTGWRGLLWPALATICVMAMLAGLGLWQLQRLAWKEAILERIHARISAPPSAPPPEAEWAKFDPETQDYRHVKISGTFAHDKEALVFRASADGRQGAGGPGYLVLTPLVQADGTTIIVNRGFVPLARRDAASRASGQVAGKVEVTGLLRPAEPRNGFTPLDNPATGEWFTRDPKLIAAHFNLTRAAPFTIDADALPASPGGLPAGGATVLAIPNDHLSYALTWFGLAVALAGVFAAFARGRLSGAAGRASQRA